MRSPRTGAVLTFNGEIYNYIELRTELERAGCAFSSTSDTEVLLAACDEWGVAAAATRCWGMFAFALWQPQSRQLHLTRDRTGKKPLYYCTSSSGLRFASEIKALRGIMPELSVERRAVGLYLALGYIPRPYTIYREVREVEPGSVLTIAGDGEHRLRRYWNYPVGEPIECSFEDAVEGTESILRDAVRLRLRSDVPVGVFLSGGIDSGLLTAFASQQSSAPIRTFTVTFGEPEFDEGPLARQIAQQYGTRHTEIRLEEDLARLLPKVAMAYDEPLGDPSALPTYAISEAAARDIKVILNGEGSDEQFCGYRRHRAMQQFAFANRMSLGLISGIGPAMSRRLPAPAGRRTPYAFLYRFLRGARSDPFERFIYWGSDGFTTGELAQMTNDPELQVSAVDHLRAQFEGLSNLTPLRHFMALDFLSMMTDALLVKIDLATMAHSLEGRSPFLDHRLIEWSCSLKTDILLHGRKSKAVLRALARRHLSTEVANAPKRGFEIPVTRWITTTLSPMLRDCASTSNGILQTLFERQALDELFSGPGAMHRERWGHLQWLLLMLALWAEQYA